MDIAGLFTSWKTTSTGIAAVLAGISALTGHISTEITTGMFSAAQLATDLATIAAGIGLIFAKDHNVTGGDTPTPPK